MFQHFEHVWKSVTGTWAVLQSGFSTCSTVPTVVKYQYEIPSPAEGGSKTLLLQKF